MKIKRRNEKLMGLLQNDFKSEKIKLCSFSQKHGQSVALDHASPDNKQVKKNKKQSYHIYKTKAIQDRSSRASQQLPALTYRTKQIKQQARNQKCVDFQYRLPIPPIKKENQLPNLSLGTKQVVNNFVVKQEIRLQMNKPFQLTRAQKLRQKTLIILKQIKENCDIIQQVLLVSQPESSEQAVTKNQRNTFNILQEQQIFQSELCLNQPKQTTRNLRALKLKSMIQKINSLKLNEVQQSYMIKNLFQLITKIMSSHDLLSNDYINDLVVQLKKQIEQLTRLQTQQEQYQSQNQLQLSSEVEELSCADSNRSSCHQELKKSKRKQSKVHIKKHSSTRSQPLKKSNLFKRMMTFQSQQSDKAQKSVVRKNTIKGSHLQTQKNKMIQSIVLNKKISRKITKRLNQLNDQSYIEDKQLDMFAIKQNQFFKEKQKLINEFMEFYHQNKELFPYPLDLHYSMDISQIQMVLRSFFQRHPFHPVRQQFQSHLDDIRKKKNQLIIMNPLRQVQPIDTIVQDYNSDKSANIFTPDMMPVYNISAIMQFQTQQQEYFARDRCEFHIRKL